MSSNADKLIAAARKYVNMTERGPQRDNYGSAKGSAAYGYSSQGGHIVDDSNIEGGYGRSNTPWCANFLCILGKETSFDPYRHKRNGGSSIMHGYTGYVHGDAKAKGWLKSGKAGCVPGAVGIKNGKHVFLVISAPDSSGRYESIGGNESDKVRHATRNLSEGWEFIVPPGLGSATGSTKVDAYLFERLDWKPTVFGAWSSQKQRDEQYDKRAAYNERENTGRLLRKIRWKGGYAFEEWPPGSWVNGGWRTYEFGPWLGDSGKATRDAQHDKYAANNPGVPLRKFRETRSGNGGGGSTPPGESGDAKYT